MTMLNAMMLLRWSKNASFTIYGCITHHN